MQHVLVTALLLVLASFRSITDLTHVNASQYAPRPFHAYHNSSPPPPFNYLYHYHSPPASPKPPPSQPPPPPFKAIVTGNVYCDICKNGHFKKPLQGVTVGVFCWNGKSEDSFYGTTNDKGAFKINLIGFDYVGCGGAKACAAKLISAPYNTPCTQPTKQNGGQKGAHLHVKANAEHEVTLEAGPFAYIPTFNYPKCYIGTSPSYKYSSPPPPSYKYESPPTYKYQSPPPPKSPPPCPPPPTYKYQSPPPPPPPY